MRVDLRAKSHATPCALGAIISLYERIPESGRPIWSGVTRGVRLSTVPRKAQAGVDDPFGSAWAQ